MPYLGNVPSSFNIGTDNINNDAITTAKIADGAILNADVNSAAAIAGTKISPDFGSQTIATTGIFSHALGSASAPTITFTGDLNTGLYSPGADQLAISTNGIGRLFVDASGRVGLGSSPTVGEAVTVGGSLLVKQAADTNGYITIQGSNTYVSTATNLILGTNGSERLRVTSAGLVGIGTSSPGRRLVIAGDTNTVCAVQGANNGTSSVFLGDTDDESIGALTYNHVSNHLEVKVNGAERVRVDSSGRVGIGTTTPSFPLEVRGSTNGLQLLGSDNVNATWRIGTPSNAVVAFGGNTDHNVAFGGFNAASNAFTERCRIDTSGRLLVGTSTSGTSTGSGQFRLGGSGSEGGTVFLTNSAGSVANNGTLDITVGTSTIIIYVGFLIVHAANANTNADRTQTTFTVFGSPQNSSFTATQISTASAGANSTFTVTSPSPGVIRVTNTSGRATHISMCFMGTGWFMT